ncbi:MAG: substrate-binding domain-containing protein [Thermoplasmata archaeon]|nr:MAG: substrate-binding domain-containing protein [Thermoplasmata archaeon]
MNTDDNAGQIDQEKFGKKYYGRTIAIIVILILIISIVGVALYYTGNPDSDEILLLATTTSTANSGLLDEILPYFEDEYDVKVKVTPVGTGQALEMGRRGDVDILMVHAPSREQEFVDDGYGTQRYLVCYNYFVIVGPPDDPVDIKSAANVTDAMNRIYEGEHNFASRGDDSGTHTKEKSLWAGAGFDYTNDIDIPENEWYKYVSAGMGDTLFRANELEAYTLSDEGTFWSVEDTIDLEIVLREDPNLLNQYSVIPANPDKFSHVNYELAMKFVEWITSEDTQDRIGSFEANDHKLFTPNA